MFGKRDGKVYLETALKKCNGSWASLAGVLGAMHEAQLRTVCPGQESLPL